MMIKMKLNHQTLLGVSIVLVLLVGATFAFILWQWQKDWQLAHQPFCTVSIAEPADETADMINAIPNAHLFGQSFTNGAVPLTNLQLQVTGIVKVNGELTSSASKAYISIAGQTSKIFQVGDSLPHGVKVYEITPDTVILQNDGRLEKLPLPREKLAFKHKKIQEHA